MGFCCDDGLAIWTHIYVIKYGAAYVITYVITYPYAWTVNFEMRLEMQLRKYQPPIRNTSQAATWSYQYIGRWSSKTECPHAVSTYVITYVIAYDITYAITYAIAR